ncbi:MAG: hypothetical protein M2R45_04614 [Verrucomicrobia subdivision 3 bacterium]|nr:hypothetical protein [Limisphaerales bacterium]MCS1417323.1 hypothetical protein [Limisphaerales bacterium]
MRLFPIVATPALQSMITTTEGLNSFVNQWRGIATALFLIGISILAYSLFTALGYSAQETWHLGAFHFLATLGMGGECSLGVALVMECWPERLHPIYPHLPTERLKTPGKVEFALRIGTHPKNH